MIATCTASSPGTSPASVSMARGTSSRPNDNSRHGVLGLDVDRVIGAELAGQRQFARVPREPGDDDRPGSRSPGGQHGGQPALARAEDQHGVAEPGPAQVYGPAHARAQ